MPISSLSPIPCLECAHAGYADVSMRFVMFEDLWMNVSVAETDATYRRSTVFRTQRKKVRTAVWRCPHGHRHQHIPE